MELTGSRMIPAAPDEVWRALNDPEVLRECIPGCESLTRESDAVWKAVVAARVGPVSARFNGTVELADVVPPASYTLRFKGQGGAVGFANGEAQVRLEPAEGGQTKLSYASKAQVGGKLAQIGSRLVDGAAASLAEDFFTRFEARFRREAQPPAGPAASGGGKAAARPWLVPALAVGAALLVLLAWIVLR